MSCTRGCQGVSLCDAVTCCLQFQQGCGTDCNGIADGYSRIQINAAGELEICSNVGGVCTCESGTGIQCCSTITNNHDGTWVHDDGQGNTTTLDVCELLRESNCTWQDAQNQWIGLVVGPATIPAGTAWTVFQGPDCQTINNPSDEDLYATVEFSAVQAELQNNAAIRENIELLREYSTDGGGTWIAAGGASGHNNIWLEPTGTPGDNKTVTFANHVEQVIIPPGGSQTFCIRTSYQSLVTGVTNMFFDIDSQRITSHSIAIPFA